MRFRLAGPRSLATSIDARPASFDSLVATFLSSSLYCTPPFTNSNTMKTLTLSSATLLLYALGTSAAPAPIEHEKRATTTSAPISRVLFKDRSITRVLWKDRTTTSSGPTFYPAPVSNPKSSATSSRATTTSSRVATTTTTTSRPPTSSATTTSLAATTTCVFLGSFVGFDLC